MHPDQLRKLVRKWTIPVVAMTILGALAAFLISKTLTPIYDAKGDILVVGGPGGQSAAAGNINLNAAQATTTAATLLTEPPLLQQVIDKLGLNTTTDALAAQITAIPQTNTELVDVTVRDPSAQRAAQIANTLMTAYVAQVSAQNSERISQAGAALQAQIKQVQAALSQDEQSLAAAKPGQDVSSLRNSIAANTALLSQLTQNYGTFEATQSQNLETVSIAAPAAVPLSRSSPRISVNTALGGVAGFVLALALAALLEFLDQGLHTADDVRERLGLPCLGVVPHYVVQLAKPEADVKMTTKQQRRMDAASEAYRRLRTNLLFAAADTDLSSVVLTSARAGEGKTRTAANLAVAIANSDKRVVLLDADMRRPSQHRLFGKPIQEGVSELILATTPERVPTLNRTHATQYDNLVLVTSGTIPPNPSELLASKRASRLFHSLAASYDMLVIDTPPAEVVTDALSVAAECSATIIVIEAGKTNAGQANAVITSLRNVGANVIGVVLNKARERDSGQYYYQYGYSDKEAAPAKEPATGTIG